MKFIKVAAATLNQTALDWEGNRQRIIDAIEAARQENVTLLCLPELCLSGYNCEDMFYAPFVHQYAWRNLQAVLPHTKGMIVSVGLPVSFQNKVFNAAAMLVDGEIVGFVAKRFLAGEGIHYEPRWFMAWPQGERGTLEVDGKHYPIGDYHFNVGGIRIGFEICEDAWVANRPGRLLHEKGIDIILNPSASHFAFDKINIRKRFVLEGSRAFGVGYIYANLLGNEAGRAIYDGGGLIASNGEMIAVGSRLTFVDYQITSAVIDVEINRLAQVQSRVSFQQVTESEDCLKVTFDYPKISPELRPIQTEAWETSPHIKEEEFTRALALGLYDYLRKSRSGGFIISLSGGADSATVACLCRLMIDLGVRSIGWEAFMEKLSYIKSTENVQNIPQLAKQLITCAYQASANSGEVTRNAAEKLAEALEVSYDYLYIDEIVKQYETLIAESIGRPLTWEKDDITLQNIQARVRAPSVWMLANLKNALLLSTSNRSEAAVGYATMDGDTSGGLSPIAGIDKAFLRQWLRWLEEEGIEGILTIPALAYVNRQQPTAELRPQESKQTDEDDLMPYDLLDDIEEYAIRDKRSPQECFQLLEKKYPQHKVGLLKTWISKFFRLWCRNQWKRERYAPSFHLDDKNLDPKTWCRFPILSGGFRQELQDLQEEE